MSSKDFFPDFVTNFFLKMYLIQGLQGLTTQVRHSVTLFSASQVSGLQVHTTHPVCHRLGMPWQWGQHSTPVPVHACSEQELMSTELTGRPFCKTALFTG